ncbi:NTPase [candidate division WOR-3 bacterium]|nr:NTPase [candidate division WOR-3 bacterium]
MRIFITGKPGTGKTTLIKKLTSWLMEKESRITGFHTEEMRKHGKRTGFRITTLPEKEKFLLSSTTPPGIQFGRYYVKIGGIEQGIQVIRREADLYIIDEIGPMEMKHPDFMIAVNEILKSDKNLLAVLHMRMKHIVSEPDKLYQLTVMNRDELYKKTKKGLEELLLSSAESGKSKG